MGECGVLVLNVTNTTNPTKGFSLFTNGTLPEEGNTTVTIFLLILCTWIFLANLFVSLVFLCNRRRMRNVSATQMLSLSVTDLQVGLSSVIMSSTYFCSGSFLTYNACAFVFFYYFMSQFASMYHTFTICLHRFIRICFRRTMTVGNTDSRIHLLLPVMLIWIASGIMAAIQFILFPIHETTLSVCSLNTLFGDNYVDMLTVACCGLLVPQITVTILYCGLFIGLMSKWRRIGTDTVSNPNGSRTSRVALGFFCRQTRKHSSTVGCVADTKSNKKDNEEKRKIYVFTIPQKGVIETDSVQNLTDDKEKRNKGDFSNKHSETACSTGSTAGEKWKTTKHCNNVHISSAPGSFEPLASTSDSTRQSLSNSTHTDNVHAKYRGTSTSLIFRSKATLINIKRRYAEQRQVMITIGIILMVLNISMTPLDVSFALERSTANELSRKAKFIMVSMSLLNSAINPLIYAFRIRPLRESSVRFVRRLFRTF